MLEQGIETPACRTGLDVKVVSYGLLGMVNWLYKWYRPGGRLTPAQIAGAFAALTQHGLERAAPGRPRTHGRRSP